MESVKRAESFRLLSISESTNEDEDCGLKKRSPDLKLPMPTNSTTNKVMGKIRRKIRLKRKQRDHRLANNQVATSTSETDLEDYEYCSPIEAVCANFNCCSGSKRVATTVQHHRQLWLNAFILFIFAVALASLAYYTMTLQNQLAVLSIHLDPAAPSWLKRNRKFVNFCHQFCFVFVILSGFLVLLTLAWLHFSLRAQTQDLSAQLHQVLDDKSTLEKTQTDLKSHLESLMANQSILQDNLTSIFSKVQLLDSQVMALNASISNALVTLAEAPQLKEVPDKVSKMRIELGQFGSRLTGIETDVQTTKDELSKVQTSLPKTSNVAQADPKSLDKESLNNLSFTFDAKLNNASAKLDAKIDQTVENLRILGTNLTQQLLKQENRANKSWKMLEQLNDDLHNVSAKAASNELVSRNNQAKLQQLANDAKNASAGSVHES